MSYLVESYKVTSTLSSQRVVAHASAAHTAQYPATTGVIPIGITIDTVKDTTSAIPVQENGKAKLYFNDTCTCGNLVAFDTSGRGVPFTPANTSTGLTLATGIIGTLVDATVAATGTVAQVLINPALMR